MIIISVVKFVFFVFCIWISFVHLKKELKKDQNHQPNLNGTNTTVDRIICQSTPLETLNRKLGAAFNSRYMAVEKPSFEEKKKPLVSRISRKIQNGKKIINDDDFEVNSEFKRILNPEEIDLNRNTNRARRNRTIRSVENNNNNDIPRAWNCKYELQWIDLGKEFFPRYLRSVKCMSEKCFGCGKCEGRAFTVTVLKKQNGSCIANVNNGSVVWLEDWIFTEIAVNFCCACTLDYQFC